jgi:hypothetical protein
MFLYKRIKKVHGKHMTLIYNCHTQTLCLCIKLEFSVELLIKWINVDIKSLQIKIGKQLLDHLRIYKFNDIKF